MSPKTRGFIVSSVMLASFGIGTQLEVSKALGNFTYCTQERCTVDKVPYLYQYDNPARETSNGGNTCQVTSLVMVLNYIYERDGVLKRARPEQFYPEREYAKTPEGVAQILKEQLGHGLWSRTGTRAELKGLIRSGRPIVINGYFTRGGHVIVITGFTTQGWIVHDPAGLWSGDNNDPYPNPDALGNHAIYSYSSLSDDVIGEDGDIWYASGDTKPINTGYGNML
jgi:hypothetical protein